MPGTQIGKPELIQLLRLDKKTCCEMLYTQYSPLLYGFILRTIPDSEIASDVLVKTFLAAYKQIDKLETIEGSIFMWILNITRGLLNSNNVSIVSSDQAHELILYKGMNCEQAAKSANKLQGEINSDLRQALHKSKQTAL